MFPNLSALDEVLSAGRGGAATGALFGRSKKKNPDMKTSEMPKRGPIPDYEKVFNLADDLPRIELYARHSPTRDDELTRIAAFARTRESPTYYPYGNDGYVTKICLTKDGKTVDGFVIDGPLERTVTPDTFSSYMATKIHDAIVANFGHSDGLLPMFTVQYNDGEVIDTISEFLGYKPGMKGEPYVKLLLNGKFAVVLNGETLEPDSIKKGNMKMLMDSMKPPEVRRAEAEAQAAKARAATPRIRARTSSEESELRVLQDFFNKHDGRPTIGDLFKRLLELRSLGPYGQ